MRRLGIWSSVIAVFVTFLIIGIWHGTGINFLILGLLQGIAINYEFFTREQRIRLFSKLPARLVYIGSCLVTYLFICFTLIFFNACSFSDAIHFITNIFVNVNLTYLKVNFLTTFDKFILFFSLVVLAIIEYRQEHGINIFEEVMLWPKWMRLTTYYAIFVLVLYFGSPHKQLIYMQF
jgi:D-alanyl-lipoteichoic acid acyltransferase DltB (MBOAT superfamily)